MQQDSAWIEHASWLLLILFWVVGMYILLRTSHFFSLSSSSSFHNSKSCSRSTSARSDWNWMKPNDRHFVQLVLAMVPTRLHGSGLGLEPEPNRCNGFYHTKTRTVAIGPVLPPKARHFNLTTLPPIKKLSSDRIITWSICALCSFRRSFVSRNQIRDQTNVRGVTLENPPISGKMCPYFTATQRISVGSQIWMMEVKELVKLHNLHIHHLMIRSELKYLMAAKAVGMVMFEPRSGSNTAKNPRFFVRSGLQPGATYPVRFLADSTPGLGCQFRFQPGPKPGNPELLLTLAFTSASIYLQMLPGPPGALQSGLRLCKSILRCFWKHLQLWMCIQDTMRFEYWDIQILMQQRQLCSSAGDLVPYSQSSGS